MTDTNPQNDAMNRQTKIGLLELLLILAIVALVGQLVWPHMLRRHHRPGRGEVGIGQTETSGLAQDYLVYLPPNYGSLPMPLVLFLHGSGERGHDPAILRGTGPFSIIEKGQTLPAIVVAPQCLPDARWDPEALLNFIEGVAGKYHIDRTRLYLVGYSMGGYGAWQTAAAHPELFAAVVPISGGGNRNDAAILASVPIWAFHGEHDNTVSVDESRRMIDAIEAAGGHPRLTVLPNASHGICESVCNRIDLWEWLLGQRRGD
jgi:predicted peptidase